MDINKVLPQLASMLERRSRLILRGGADATYFLLKLNEEIGEVCGAFTKNQRGFNLREFKKTMIKKGIDLDTVPDKDKHRLFLDEEVEWVNKRRVALEEELADTFLMLLQASNELGVDYLKLIKISVEKFNKVSTELGEDYTQFNINIEDDKEEDHNQES